MTIKADPNRYAALQTAAQRANDEARSYRISLDVRYSHGIWAKRTEQKRVDQLDARAQRAFDKYFTYLSAISPRDWSVSVPCSWILYNLSFADAITKGQLSVVPDAAWGYTEHHMRQFAAEIR